MNLYLYTDGGARGNPGVSGFGVVVQDDDQRSLYQESRYLGIKTNNEAEYLALISALTWLKANYSQYQVTHFTLCLDSQLVARQVAGGYKVKAAHLRPLHQQAIRLLAEINLPYRIQEIPRSQNYLADRLANQAMDNHP